MDNKEKVVTYGGQAVIEGVMMRGQDMYALSVRNTSGEIVTETKDIKKVTNKLLKLPLMRGIYSFYSSMVVGMKITTRSMELSGLEDDEEPTSKFEAWLMKKMGDNLTKVITALSVIIAIILSMFLFAFLPVWVSHLFLPLIGEHLWALSVIEGVVKLVIFISYLLLISLNSDIKRTFMYHGAEHKTINCFEANEELTVENARKHTRIHKRCGTSFLIIVLLITIAFFMLFTATNMWVRFSAKIIFLPFIAGISYEVLKTSSKTDNLFIRVFSAPGMWIQRITTKEPNDEQLEVAITALKTVLEDKPVVIEEVAKVDTNTESKEEFKEISKEDSKETYKEDSKETTSETTPN